MRTANDPIGIAGWFAPENREVLEQLMLAHDVRKVIEIGSFLGLSAVWFAQRVEAVTCVDTWIESASEATENNLVGTLRRWELPRDFFPLFRDNVMRSGYWHKILPMRGSSEEMMPWVEPADLLYIDGDHSFGGCFADIEMYKHKAKIVCGDDYSERPGFGVIAAVTRAFPNHEHLGPFWWAVQE